MLIAIAWILWVLRAPLWVWLCYLIGAIMYITSDRG